MSIDRRSFLKGCAGSLVALGGADFGLGLAFAGDGGRGGSQQRDILVKILLRGGMDGLNLVVPYTDSNYLLARPTLGLGANDVLDINGLFGFHPSAERLQNLYNMGDLALVLACGSPSTSRSLSEAYREVESGVPDDPEYAGGGWLGRFLNVVNEGGTVFQAVSQTRQRHAALDGYSAGLTMERFSSFNFQGSSSHRDDMRRSMRFLYDAHPSLGQMATQALDVDDQEDALNPGTYSPQNGANYGGSSIGTALSNVAQLIRLGVGVNVATIEMDRWDTYFEQAYSWSRTAGPFADRVSELSQALEAFWIDLASMRNNITVVVMSEFGRRVRENSAYGTDHGRAGLAMVLSGNATGGIYGDWPGLGFAQLEDGVDLRVMTDYRRVWSEVLLARMNFTLLNKTFPGYSYPGPLGIFGAAGEFPIGGTGTVTY